MQPTNRGILILLLAAPIMAAGTWLPALQWVALGYLLLVGGLLWFDWRAAEPIEKRFDIRREHDQKLSLGADNPIKISIRNRSNRSVTVWLRDEPPDAFNISQRLLTSDIA